MKGYVDFTRNIVTQIVPILVEIQLSMEIERITSRKAKKVTNFQLCMEQIE